MPAGRALTAEIVRALLVSPDAAPSTLASALQESMRQFESLLSCVSGTFYRCALSAPWCMEFISPGIAEISGYAPSVFETMPFGEIIEPDDLPLLQSAVEAGIARREHFVACYRIRHRSGEVRWVSERGAAVYGEDGRPQFLEGFITDVTAAKRLEIEAEQAREQVEKLNARMASVLEHSLDGIVSFGPDWTYRFANRTALIGVPPEFALCGKRLLDVYPSLAETGAWPVMQRAMIDREAGSVECYMAAFDAWFEVYAVPDGDGITAFFRDVSHAKQLEHAFQSRAEDLEATLDSIPDMVWTAHPEGKGDYFNRAFNDFIGRSPADVAAGRMPTADWIHPEDLGDTLRSWNEAFRTGNPFELELRMRHHSGEYRWLLARAWAQRDDAGRIVKWCGTATDIHERILAERELQESKNLQSSILEASMDCIEIMDLQGRLIFVNRPTLSVIGVEDGSAVIGKRWPDLWYESGRQNAERALKRAQRGKVARFIECIQAPHLNGTTCWDVIVSPIRGTDGVISNVLCIARDVTEQRATAERLRIASEHDVLTTLPNRRAFELHLKRVTTQARSSGASVGLMLLDLDHFKHVNDTLGHLAGDHLLKVVARRLRACVGDSAFVARLGGDEFAIVIDHVEQDSELIGAAARILERMEAPVTFAGKLINGGLSIGCAIYPRDASDALTLLKHADTALYDLKASGRGGSQMFNNRMMEAAQRTATQLSLARTAIRDNAVEPYYQPKVRLDTGKVAGFEALLRWWSPGNGIQPPGSVAEAFNDYELSTKIGGQMQRRIFADMSAWLGQGLSLPPVSINAAPAEFLRDDYAERLLDRLGEAGIAPALIEVEITEHVFLERRSEQVVRALELLKSAGVRIALDDFGTGHSSLSHLRDFPVDVLKIDRSFVSRMLTKPRMLAIVQAITKLGPSLSLDIVAEGVETPEQLHALRDAGCEFGQGYLFGKAMDASEVARRLASAEWPFRLKPD